MSLPSARTNRIVLNHPVGNLKPKVSLPSARTRLNQYWFFQDFGKDFTKRLLLPTPQLTASCGDLVRFEGSLGHLLRLRALSEVAASAQGLAVLQGGGSAMAPRFDVVAVHKVEWNRSRAEHTYSTLALPYPPHIASAESPALGLIHFRRQVSSVAPTA